MKHKGLVLLGVLSTICLVIQLLPVISVPITGRMTNYNLHLSIYNNNSFGVFGVCDLSTNHCSRPSIGYPSKKSDFYGISNPDIYESQFGGIKLPSRATYTISKLLVVHVIAFCLTALLCIVILYLLLTLHFDSLHDMLSKVGYKKLHSDPKPTSDSKKTKRDLTPYLNAMLIISMFSFLLTLLAFLVDILLFIPHLSYLGWLQLIPIVFMTIEASMICFHKRYISSRKYLDDDNKNTNDDMRLRENVDISRWDDDAASDDGFVVYTNGFYSNYNDNATYLNDKDFSNGGWIRHTPYNDTADEDSINSSQAEGRMNAEQIEMEAFGTNNPRTTEANDRTLC